MSATLHRGGAGRHVLYVLRGNPVTAVAAAGTALLVAVALLAPWLVPYDPVASDVSSALQPPGAAHWAGTDQLGRDIGSRILMAARLDLLIAASAVSLSFVVGAAVGGFCGYRGGRLDRWVGRFVDVLMAFPLFVLAMGIVAALGNTVPNIVLATAHAAKFPDAVEAACGVRPALPAYLEGLMSKPEHIKVMKNDQSDIERFVLSVSRAAKQGAI